MLMKIIKIVQRKRFIIFIPLHMYDVKYGKSKIKTTTKLSCYTVSPSPWGLNSPLSLEEPTEDVLSAAAVCLSVSTGPSSYDEYYCNVKILINRTKKQTLLKTHTRTTDKKNNIWSTSTMQQILENFDFTKLNFHKFHSKAGNVWTLRWNFSYLWQKLMQKRKGAL